MSFKENTGNTMPGNTMPGNTRLQQTVEYQGASTRGSTSPHYCKECLGDLTINQI